MTEEKPKNENSDKSNEPTSLVIKYWGVRGSIPAPLTKEQKREAEISLVEKIFKDIREGGTRKMFEGEATREKIGIYLDTLPLSIAGTYGGDTTCIEVQVKDSPLIVIDAGSGARALGGTLLGRLFSGKNLNPLNSDEETKRDIHFLFSHYHWDHIQGFPFFGPAFIPGNMKVNINFYGQQNAKKRLSHVLEGQQQYPNFPVEWPAMPCDKKYIELGRMAPIDFKLGSSLIKYAELDHPDRVLGYSIESNGKKFICATDTEHRDVEDPVLVKLAKDADIMYYDAQYTPEEYSGKSGMSKVRWGHSTYEWAIKTALSANVKKIVLGHHEPMRDDFALDKLFERAQSYASQELNLDKNNGKSLEVIMAYQGLEQKL